MNNAELADRMRLLRSHGVTRDPALMEGHSQGAWYYEQVDLGYNYRMTDIQAALGTSQMQRIDGLVRMRHAIAGRYKEELANLPIILPWQSPDTYSAYHLYPIRVDPLRTRLTRKEVFANLAFHMRRQGVAPVTRHLAAKVATAFHAQPVTFRLWASACPRGQTQLSRQLDTMPILSRIRPF